MSLISCKNCTLAYDSNVLIKDLSFSVNAGDYLCIVGKNGSGKSTLMHALLGLKQLNGGEIEYGDGLSKTGIGFLPQQTNVRFDFPASVFEVCFRAVVHRICTTPLTIKKMPKTSLSFWVFLI